MRFFRSWMGSVGVGLALVGSLAGQAGTVKGTWKLSQRRGGAMPPLDANDQLGRSVTVLGDLDGNGVVDLATAGLGDDDGGTDQGAAYVLFLRRDGRVIGHRKISETSGGFGGDLRPGDQFGRSMTGLGDLDGDGVPDLAVGANYDDDGGMNRGAVWILNLNPDGTVRSTAKISSLRGDFAGPLRNNDEFGRSLACLGDLDGDGVPDLAVGAPTDSTGGTRRGAVWILFLRDDGRVKRAQKIASATGGFTGRLKSLDWFGFSLANAGDLDGDGVTDLAVGAALDDDGGTNTGALWLLYLRPDGTVKDQRKISLLAGGFTGLLESPDQFGTSVARIGDLNGDGIPEFAVGAVKDGDGGKERGAVYVLFLTPGGTVAFHRKISELEGGFPSRQLDNFDWLGSSVAPLGDFDGDGWPDLVVGARNDDDGASNSGALYLAYLNGSASASASLALRGASAPELDADAAVSMPAATERADRIPALAFETLALGPEPDGSLPPPELDAHRARVRLRVPVPARFAGHEAVLHLLVARRAWADLEAGERTGLRIDPSALLGTVPAVATEADREVEVAFDLPARFAAEGLALQGLWSRGAQRQLTDALELVPGPSDVDEDPLAGARR